MSSQIPLEFVLVLGGSNSSPTGPPTRPTPLYMTDLQGYDDLGASLPQLTLLECLVCDCLGVTHRLFSVLSLYLPVFQAAPPPPRTFSFYQPPPLSPPPMFIFPCELLSQAQLSSKVKPLDSPLRSHWSPQSES